MRITLSAALLLTVFAVQAQKSKPVKVKIKTIADSVSYALGANYANKLKEQIDLGGLNPLAIAKGIEDVVNKSTPLWSTGDSDKLVESYYKSKKEEAEKTNKEAGEKYLKELDGKKGFTKTESGLIYEVLKANDAGTSPTLASKVTVHYEGKLIDGTVFDSSIKRGQPASFPVGGVIRGWVEALQLMKTGEKWRLHIPQDLGYGSRGTRGIPSYSVLVFEVELISID